MKGNIDVQKFNERQRVMLLPLNIHGRGLEIGPGDRPLAPKKDGFDMETIDSMDREGLINKFKNGPYPRPNTEDFVEEIDYVWDGKSYAELTGKTDHYDFIVTSNVIEHVPDVIGHLIECGEVLKDGGIYSIAIPDKRYCIDIFRPVSSLGSALDSYKKTNHSIGSVVDFISYHTQIDGRAAWNDSYFSNQNYSLTFSSQSRKDFIKQRENGDYIDIHNWVFTVSSFKLLIKELYFLGLIDFVESEPAQVGFNTAENYWEFYVFLRKDPTRERDVNDVERLSLLISIQNELRDRFNTGITQKLDEAVRDLDKTKRDLDRTTQELNRVSQELQSIKYSRTCE